jgi:sarcosine oxidase subunit beta
MAPGYDVAIVGAGNLGMWTAYHLARRGVRRIVVCDRAWAGSGATTRSAGIVRQQGGSVTAVRLGMLSREWYMRLGEELRLDSGFREVGYYVLAASPAEQAAFQELVALRRECGLENQWLDADDGRRRFPALSWDAFLGATYSPTDGYVHPPIVARNITAALARSEAIELLEQCAVDEIEATAVGYRLRTSRGILEAERIVNAGGPRGSRALGALLDIDVPVSAARHQVMSFPHTGPDLATPFPMLFALSRGLYIRPEEQGILLGFSNPGEQADHSGRYQLDYDWAYHEELRPTWEAIFPALKGQQVSRAWAASIDYTPDNLPIIDEPRPGCYVLAAGGHGMMWGPGLGFKMAELIATGQAGDLPDEEIRLARFQAERTTKDAIALPFPDDQRPTTTHEL